MPAGLARRGAERPTFRAGTGVTQDTAESIVVRGVELTHPDRVLFPDQGVTKRMLADYYERASARMLPYVEDRPLTLVRCPDGRAGDCFYQKHGHDSVPDAIRRIGIRERSGKRASYMYVDSGKGLVAAAQIGALELHVWGARRDRLERPERLVFDLDPDEGLPFSRVRAAALELKDVLASAGLKSFALLTGGKGIHVIAPLRRTRDWDDVKTFARGLAGRLAETAPDNYVATASKSARSGKIFIDWLRNERGATAVAPYSPRARRGAPVAAPVAWSELPACESAQEFRLDTVARRFTREDRLWPEYFDLRQSITRAHLAPFAAA